MALRSKRYDTIYLNRNEIRMGVGAPEPSKEPPYYQFVKDFKGCMRAVKRFAVNLIGYFRSGDSNPNNESSDMRNRSSRDLGASL